MNASQIQQDLEKGFGGMTATAEKPSFGDQHVASVPMFVSTYTSTLQPPVTSKPMSSFRVALLWGHFPAPSDASDADVAASPASWTGSVSVDDGTIDVARTLSFDTDDSVDPRTAPNVVSFTSQTLPFVDGLLLHITTPTDGSHSQLHFATNELTTDIDLQVVAGGAGSITHASGDQGLAAVGWNDTGATCPAGIAYGRWVKLHGGLGTLRGHVMAGDGTDLGFVRGIWGHATNHDADVFFAKYIDLGGNFEGLIDGTYGSGQLSASWGNAATQNGTFVGVYADGKDMDDGRGVFVSKWMTHCLPL